MRFKVDFSKLLWILLLIVASCTGDTSQPAATLEQPVITATFVPPSETPFPTRTPTAEPTESTPLPSTFQVSIQNPEVRHYVYAEPDTMSVIIRIAQGLPSLQLVGRTEDSLWLQVVFSDSASGWMKADEIFLEYDIVQVPVTGVTQNRGVVAHVKLENPDGTSLWQSPDTESSANVIRGLPPLTPLEVIGRLEDGLWLQVQAADGAMGWVRSENLEITFSTAAVVIVPADAIAVAEAANNQPALADGRQSQVSASATGLRLRQYPSTDGLVMVNLRAETPLVIVGRLPDNSWIMVRTPDGLTGWVAAGYLDVFIDLNRVSPVVPPTPEVRVETASTSAPVVSSNLSAGLDSANGNIVTGAHNIFLRGQQLGIRANAFSMVGDSLTDSTYYLRPIAYGYNLYEYDYLASAIQYFTPENFNHLPKSARQSWASHDILNPQNADLNGCQPSESPLRCEIRLQRPAVMLIMIGTNDARDMQSAENYRGNLRRIVEICIENGVVPVLSTLPPRADDLNTFVLQYNDVIRAMTQTYDIPLWDFYSEITHLPKSGLDSDGVHLSLPPNAPASTADFNAEYLQYGTTMRNLSTLRILDYVWRTFLS